MYIACIAVELVYCNRLVKLLKLFKQSQRLVCT